MKLRRMGGHESKKRTIQDRAGDKGRGHKRAMEGEYPPSPLYNVTMKSLILYN
jgi:hypothetical protein